MTSIPDSLQLKYSIDAVPIPKHDNDYTLKYTPKQPLNVRVIFDRPFYESGQDVLGHIVMEWSTHRNGDLLAVTQVELFHHVWSCSHTHTVSSNNDIVDLPWEEDRVRSRVTHIIHFRDDGAQRQIIPFAIKIPKDTPPSVSGAALKVIGSPVTLTKNTYNRSNNSILSSSSADQNLLFSRIMLTASNIFAVSMKFLSGAVATKKFKLLVVAPGHTAAAVFPLRAPPTLCSESAVVAGEVILKTDRSWYEPGAVVTVSTVLKNQSYSALPPLIIGITSFTSVSCHPDATITHCPWSMWVISKPLPSLLSGQQSVLDIQFILPVDLLTTYRDHAHGESVRYEIVVQHENTHCVESSILASLPLIVRPPSTHYEEWDRITRLAINTPDFDETPEQCRLMEVAAAHIAKRVHLRCQQVNIAK